VLGHCSIYLRDITLELRSAYTTTRIIPVAKHITFQISLSGVGCWYRMRDPRYLRMTFGGFLGLESKRYREMMMFCPSLWQVSCTSADSQTVSISPPARRGRRKVFSFLAYNLTLLILGTNREGKTGAQASQ
jgi:hypothetical protein